MDWIGWYPGGVKYRAPYGANKEKINLNVHDDFVRGDFCIMDAKNLL